MALRYFKYHALGNDYLVIDPKDLPSPLTTEEVKTICHRIRRQVIKSLSSREAGNGAS